MTFPQNSSATAPIHCGLLVGDVPQGAKREAEVLAPEERRLLGERAVEKRRSDFIRGRWVAKSVLAGVDPSRSFHDFVILPDEHGAPHVQDRDGSALDLSVSITHTRGYAAAAVTPLPFAVGVDAEHPLRNANLIASDYFTPSEIEICRSLDGQVDPRTAATVWTVKEAMTKALGVGLRVPLSSVTVGSLQPACATTAAGWRAVAVAHESPAGERAGLMAWVRNEGEVVLALVLGCPTGIKGVEPRLLPPIRV